MEMESPSHASSRRLTGPRQTRGRASRQGRKTRITSLRFCWQPEYPTDTCLPLHVARAGGGTKKERVESVSSSSESDSAPQPRNNCPHTPQSTNRRRRVREHTARWHGKRDGLQGVVLVGLHSCSPESTAVSPPSLRRWRPLPVGQERKFRTSNLSGDMRCPTGAGQVSHSARSNTAGTVVSAARYIRVPRSRHRCGADSFSPLDRRRHKGTQRQRASYEYTAS